MEPLGYINLILLWILFFWLYRDYRLQYFRQQLFALRDELFDMALSNELRFDDPAYGQLRSTINGTIQYGHQLGFLQLVCLWWFTNSDPVRIQNANRYKERWEAACNELSPSAQKNIQAMRQRLHFLILQQVVFTSFVLFATLFAFVLAVLLHYVQRSMLRRFKSLLTATRIHDLVNALDSAAALRAS
jgi:hypothetical protein